MVDPDIWQDEKFNKLSFGGRLLFIGLITIANDYGKARGNPIYLKSQIFPYETNDIEIIKEIKKLDELGMITSYKINDEQFIEIKNWNKYQTLTYKGKDTIPSPILKKPLINPEETLNKPLTASKVKISKDNIYIDRFLAIWQLYPKKVGKNKAFEHFKRTVKTEKDLENTKKALNNYLQTKRVKEGYIQDGKRWFKEWQDWIEYKEEEKGKEDWRDAHRRKKT